MRLVIIIIIGGERSPGDEAIVIIMSVGIYSGASLNGPSEKRITSQQRTYLQERNDRLPIDLVYF